MAGRPIDHILRSRHRSGPGSLPPSAFSWEIILHHCPSNCHTHPIQSFSGVTTGSFSAPDHDYPSQLEIKLTVTDAGGLKDTKSVLLDPQTVALNFASTPSGLELVVGSSSAPTPFYENRHPGIRELRQCRHTPALGRYHLLFCFLVGWRQPIASYYWDRCCDLYGNIQPHCRHHPADGAEEPDGDGAQWDADHPELACLDR